MNRSTAVLIVFVLIIGVGAIVIAKQTHAALTSPAGERAKSIERLRNLGAALRAYHGDHGAWPDQLVQVIRARKLPLAAFGGVRYRHPRPGDAETSVLLWRETPLPAVARGEPWGGPDKPAERDHPAIAVVVGIDGVVRQVDPAELAALEAPR